MMIYNVKDFGAVGDGVADDTAAFQAAFAAAGRDMLIAQQEWREVVAAQHWFRKFLIRMHLLRQMPFPGATIYVPRGTFVIRPSDETGE